MKNPKINLQTAVMATVVVAAAVFALVVKSVTAQATPMAKVFIDNARYSFVGALASGNTASSSVALINSTQNMTGAIYSVSSRQLQGGDLLRVGSNFYYVATGSTIVREDQITLDRALNQSDIAEGTKVNYRALSNINVGVKTSSVTADGALRVLIPAVDATVQASDGQADPGFFDFNLGATVTCPGNVTGFDFGTGIASPSATSVLIYGNAYHSFTCPYVGTGASGTDFGFEVGSNYLSIKGLLNPAPGEDHVIGEVDLSTIIVQELNAAGAVVKSNYVNAGIVDAVRTVVRVAPQITFQIEGVASNQTRCSDQVTTDVATTGIEVPFADISSMMFKNAAQALQISTNAANGYVITVTESDQLSLNGGGCAATATGENEMNCINDFLKGGGSPTTAAAWTDPTTEKGFGYTVGTVAGFTNPTYTDSAGVAHQAATGFTGVEGQHFKKFADKSAGENPVIVLKNTSSTNNDKADVCYRVIPATNIVPGDYENSLIFTATATF
jgi:hypothetical protein